MIEQHETTPARPRRWLKIGAGLCALVTLSAATGWGAATFASTQIKSQNIDQLRTALKMRLPKTPIDALDCAGHGGLCEVVSKTTLFYVDTKAKYLVIGRIYDMEARQDLTAARLLALNPDLLTAGAARSDGRETRRKSPRRPASPAKISLSGLPTKGAIHWGPANGPSLSSFPISSAAIAANYQMNSNRSAHVSKSVRFRSSAQQAESYPNRSIARLTRQLRCMQPMVGLRLPEPSRATRAGLMPMKPLQKSTGSAARQ